MIGLGLEKDTPTCQSVSYDVLCPIASIYSSVTVMQKLRALKLWKVCI